MQKVYTKTEKLIKGLRLRTDSDRDIPTHDYELLQAVTGQMTAGNGSGGGSESLHCKAVGDSG